MVRSGLVLLDANVIIYALDESSSNFGSSIESIQRLQANGLTLCTSHHIVEKVLYVAKKAGVEATEVVKELGKLPGLVLIEPDASLDFAARYARLCDRLQLDINDSLLLQLMLDADILYLLTYDKKFANKAEKAGIKLIKTA